MPFENATAHNDVNSVKASLLTVKPDPSEVYRQLSEKSISYDLKPVENNKIDKSTSAAMSKNKNVTKIFAMRHGERLDFTFGNWLSYSLNEAGDYVQQDLNMPVELPKRSDPQVSYLHTFKNKTKFTYIL